MLASIKPSDAISSRDQRQKKDGIGFVTITVFRRHLVPRRLEDDATGRGDNHAYENNGGSVVLYRTVQAARRFGEARQHDIAGDSYDQERECLKRQYQKAGKYQNVNGSRESKARLLPLAQPILEQPLQPKQRPIETIIAFGAEKRSQPLCHDVGKTCETQHREDGKQDWPRDRPVGRLRRGRDAVQHSRTLSRNINVNSTGETKVRRESLPAIRTKPTNSWESQPARCYRCTLT